MNLSVADAAKRWGDLNRELGEHFVNRQWGLYRNTRLAMGDVLKKEKRYIEALQTYLEVCFLDMNGAWNGATFHREPEELAPGILDYIRILVKRVSPSSDELRELFVSQNKKVRENLNLPFLEDEAWEVFKSSFEKIKKEP